MATATQLSAGHDEAETHVVLERVHILYEGSSFVAFSALLVAGLTAAMLWSSQPQYIVTVWIMAHSLIALLRGILLRDHFKNKMTNMVDALRWVKLYALCALLSGSVWGQFGMVHV